MEKDKELNFKPVTEGLGFHPFSDGLPYAPVSKTKKMGTGAESAGPALPVLPVMSPPARRKVQPIAPTVFTAPIAAPPLVAPIATPPQKAVNTPVSLDAPVDLHLGFFYSFKRMIAFSIDTLLHTLVCTTLIGGFLWQQDLDLPALITPSLALVFFLLLVAFNWTLTTTQEVAFGTTLGKRLFGLHLNGSAAALFMRAFFFLPSFFFCGVGLIWAVFSKRKRCWHDAVVDIQPL